MSGFAWSAHLVADALGLPIGGWDHAYAGVVTDTRAARPGDVFVALRGERFDGHDFLGDARVAGVLAVVVRAGTPRWPGIDWFEVDDTLAALGRLARFRRDRAVGPVVAITGTNGKTATKELAAAAVGAFRAVHRSPGNLNNLVGVPLTLLAMPVEAEVAIVECGASLRGELAALRGVARPDVGVVTNVGAGHLEGFGSVEDVLAEKLSLVSEAGTVIVGDRPRHLADAARSLGVRVVTVSAEGPADWAADSVTVGEDGCASFRVRGVEVSLAVPGRHQVANALCALAVADAVGVPLDGAASAIRAATLPAGRTAVRETGGVTVIDDTYNANPQSFAAALDLLAVLRRGRRAVIVAGTMRELGAGSAALHSEVAERVVAAGPDLVVAVGDFAPAFEPLRSRLPEGSLVVAADPLEVAEPLARSLRPGDVALFKASRGVRLERLFPLLWPSKGSGEGNP